MKIAFFMGTILEQGGGLEKYLIETSAGLATTYPNDEIAIVTMDADFTLKLNHWLSFYYFRKVGPENIYRESTADVKEKLGSVKYINTKSFKELAAELKKYDVIYSKNEFIEAFIFKFIIGYKNLPPIIFGVHTPHIYPVVRSIQARLHNVLYGSFVFNFFVSGVKAFHVSNQFSYDKISKQLSKKSVYLIYYPFDIERFKSKLTNTFDLKLKTDTKKILWLARLSEQKGIDDLCLIIDEINQIPEFKHKIDWIVAGSGEEKYEQMLNVLQEKYDNIKLLGHIENKFVPSLLQESDLFISTSKWEVSPFNIMEAQSMDVPIIAFNIPGPEDIVTKKSGILVQNVEQFKDSINAVVDNKISFSNISTDFSLKFSPPKIYAKLHDMFQATKDLK